MHLNIEACCRRALFVLTFLSLAIGIILLVFGTFILLEYNTALVFINASFIHSTVFIPIAGALIIISSTFGELGSYEIV